MIDTFEKQNAIWDVPKAENVEHAQLIINRAYEALNVAKELTRDLACYCTKTGNR